MARQLDGGAGLHGRQQIRGRERKADAKRDALLSAYLDGQLSASERARLEAQLAADADLRAELSALRCTVGLLRQLPAAPMPRNFLLPVSPQAQQRPVARSRLAFAAPWLTAAAAAVATMLAVVLAGQILLSGMALAPAA